MNYLYIKLMSWAVGEALANSDRVRVMALALVGIFFTRLLAACPQCSLILTPDVVNALTIALGGAAVTLVAALSHRDVGAPGQSVPGAAPVVPPVPVVPNSTAPKSAALLLAFLLLGLGSTVKAASFGPIAISPATGTLSVVVKPILGASFWRAGSGAVMVSEKDVLGGLQVALETGPYGLGLCGALDQDVENGVMYGAAGVVGEFMPYGEAFAVWRDAGCLVGLTFPWGAGATLP